MKIEIEKVNNVIYTTSFGLTVSKLYGENEDVPSFEDVFVKNIYKVIAKNGEIEFIFESRKSFLIKNIDIYIDIYNILNNFCSNFNKVIQISKIIKKMEEL